MPHEMRRARGTATLPTLQNEPETRRDQAMHPEYRKMDAEKAGTSKPLMIIILKAMREWLNEGILEIEWDFPEDIDHEGCTQALAEQQLI